MSAFCAEQGISRKTFYAIRARARSEGPAAALEPRSTRPAPGPTRIGQEMVLRALAVRSALESSGLDHGPISVHDKMRSMGLEAPSPASPARIFRRKGVARSEPRKRPRSAWRRFVYPAPNARRRLDATEYVLAGGRKAVIFQLQDDHSRLAVASLVAPGETSDAAIAVFDKGVAAHGVPQRLLTDNGAALNPSRRGHAGRLVEHVRALGVEPITGRPRKPTTQGKNERFHQTLLRYLDKQPPAESIADLQVQVDAFDRLYNTRRPHQGPPGRITPQQAWDATPVADPPRPDRVHDEPALTTRKPPARSRTPRRGERRSRIRANGTVTLGSITFLVSRAHAGCDVEITRDPDTVVFATPDGQVLVQHTWPAPGVTYVSTHGPDPTNSRGGRGRKKTRLSPMS